MLFLGWLGRSTRFVGVGVALVASIATTAQRSEVRGEVTLGVASPEDGEVAEVPLMLEVAGHPAITEQAALDIWILDVDADTSVDAAIEIEGPSGELSTDRGFPVVPAELRGGAYQVFDEHFLDPPICAEAARCEIPLVVRVRDADVAGVPVRFRVMASVRFSSGYSPPGEVVLREVSP